MTTLTDGMKIALRKIQAARDGVRLSDLDERTVNALIRRKLVRCVWVDLTYTPKGRPIPAHQRVYPEDFGKRITIHAGSWLKDDAGPVVQIHRDIELIGEWMTDSGDGRGYRIPLNGQTVYAFDRHVKDINDFPCLKRFTFDEADEINTQRLTCHDCGNWLAAGSEGYGTEYGWCGCEEKP